MAGPAVFQKDPNSIAAYNIDWSDWLATGDSVVISAWTIPSGLIQDSVAFTTTTTQIVLSGGGSLGTLYEILNHITTANDLEEVRSLLIQMAESKGGVWLDGKGNEI